MQNVNIHTGDLGYKTKYTKVSFSFHKETKPNTVMPQLLGNTHEVIIFDSFQVENLDQLLKEVLNFNEEKVIKHLKSMVKLHLTESSLWVKAA